MTTDTVTNALEASSLQGVDMPREQEASAGRRETGGAERSGRSPEDMLTEMDRLQELTGSNLEAFAKTFAVLARPVFAALISCREHWKVSFWDERSTVIRLRRVIYDLHNSADPRSCCKCYDCNIVRSHKGGGGAELGDENRGPQSAAQGHIGGADRSDEARPSNSAD